MIGVRVLLFLSLFMISPWCGISYASDVYVSKEIIFTNDAKDKHGYQWREEFDKIKGIKKTVKLFDPPLSLLRPYPKDPISSDIIFINRVVEAYIRNNLDTIRSFDDYKKIPDRIIMNASKRFSSYTSIELLMVIPQGGLDIYVLKGSFKSEKNIEVLIIRSSPQYKLSMFKSQNSLIKFQYILSSVITGDYKVIPDLDAE